MTFAPGWLIYGSLNRFFKQRGRYRMSIKWANQFLIRARLNYSDPAAGLFIHPSIPGIFLPVRLSLCRLPPSLY